MSKNLNKEKSQEKFFEFALEDYKYYGRRFEQVILIVSGFGLFACLELYKLKNNSYLSLIYIPAALFVITIILSLISLYNEKVIRDCYLDFMINPDSTESKKKSEKLERLNIRLESWALLFLIVSIIILAIAFFVNI